MSAFRLQEIAPDVVFLACLVLGSRLWQFLIARCCLDESNVPLTVVEVVQ